TSQPPLRRPRGSAGDAPGARAPGTRDRSTSRSTRRATAPGRDLDDRQPPADRRYQVRGQSGPSPWLELRRHGAPGLALNEPIGAVRDIAEAAFLLTRRGR